MIDMIILMQLQHQIIYSVAPTKSIHYAYLTEGLTINN